MRIVLGAIFLFGLLYLILPGPTQISDFSGLPNSVKSDEPGDTYQHPNIAAYFSNEWRTEVTEYYYNEFKNLHCSKIFNIFPNPICYIPPMRLNHPPELAFGYIRDQQLTTYLEEYLYPMRESIFVNGYEPYDKSGKAFGGRSQPLAVNGVTYPTKTTLRYYPSNVFWRILVYIGTWGALVILFRDSKKAFKK